MIFFCWLTKNLRIYNNSVLFSERSNGRRSSIIIPVSGLNALSEALASISASDHILIDDVAETPAVKSEKTPAVKSKKKAPRRKRVDPESPAGDGEEVVASAPAPEAENSSKVYVLNVAFSTSDETLAALVCSVGHVPVKCVVERSKAGRSFGRALVQLESPQAAEQVIAALQGALLEGRNIELKVTHARSHMHEVTSAVSSATKWYRGMKQLTYVCACLSVSSISAGAGLGLSRTSRRWRS